MKLCCFFNYAPLYRESIYSLIDENFDTQFYFGDEVIEGRKSGIARLDYKIFRNVPVIFKNKLFFQRFKWRTKCIFLPFKKYDTFLITGDFVYSYIPFLLFCKLLRKRVLAWGHGIKTRKGKGHYLNDFFYRIINGFLSYGETGKKRLIELGYDSKKITIIYNSLGKRNDTPQNLKSDIYKAHFQNTHPVIIFIGRLTPQKSLDWLLFLQNALRHQKLLCNIVFVGDGVCKNGLMTLAKDLMLEDYVWFYGECYDDGITNELLYNADLCVSPGNVGLTALHSMRNGTPVVSHNDFETQMPEYETIIPGLTGDLFIKDDFKDFCEVIERWLIDKKDRDALRQNCYEVINSKWNSDNQIEILKEVLSSNGK